jgi:hypothetical protein
VGRTTAAALLARQAQWSLDHEQDRRALAAALRFAAAGIHLLGEVDPSQSSLLADER